MAQRRSVNLRIFVFLLVGTIITLFFAWTRLQNTRLKRELSRLRQEEQRLSVENSKLQFEWAQLTLPKKLEQIGGERFNLKRARPDQVVVLREK